MSKSKGNVIYADDAVDLFGVDAVRYFFIHEMPFESDGVVGWDIMIERYNSDLANVLGNLVNRTVSMSNKYFDGLVVNTNNNPDPWDEELKNMALNTVKEVSEKMDNLRVADALTSVFNLFKRCNKYIDETTPWILGKDEDKKDRLASVLYNLIETITIGASLLQSFMPETADKIVKQLNTELRSYEDMDTFGLYPDNNKLEKPEMLFARLDSDAILEKVEEIRAAQIAESGAPEYPQVEAKPEITIDDVDKVQLRVGEVIACEKVKKSKKLLCSQIRIGDEVRQIVSGIANYYKPEEMVGKKVVVVTNLKPAKLCGIESQGMILAAGDDKDNLSVLTVDKDIIAGSEIS
jgi:methionyl-tRNA synthetase